MDLSLDQLSFAVAEARGQGLTVELSTPAISDGYEKISSFEPAGEGYASVKVTGMGYMEYLVPATTIQGFRIYKDAVNND